MVLDGSQLLLELIEKFLDLITKFKQPITIMNLDEFLEKEDEEKEIPQPLLLLKMNFKQ